MNTNFKNGLFLGLAAIALVVACDDKLLDTKSQEELELNKLSGEIKTLSSSVTCENAGEWKFTRLGSACFPDNGYVVYAKTIDTTKFLSLVTEYNDKYEKFSQKYGIACMPVINREAQGVTCENGSAKLIFK